MKKLLSIILAALMLVTFIPTNIEAAKFKDVPDSEWYAEYVNKAASAGVIKGYGDGTFKPKGNIAFTEISSLLANLVNVSEADLKVANATYGKDLDALLNQVKQQGNPGIDWVRPSILKCLYAGVYDITNLKTAVESKMLLDTKPGERRLVSRSNTAYFLANALKLDVQAASLPYKDTAEIPANVQTKIQALINIGVLSKAGDGTGKFRPNDQVDRASIAKMITVSMDYLEKNPPKPITPPEPPKPVSTSIEGTVTDVSESGNQAVVLVNTGSKSQSVIVSYKTEITVDGSPALFDKIATGMKGNFTYNPTTAEATKVVVKSVEETIEGKISAIYSTYRYEIEYQKGSILNNKIELDLRDASITLDGSKASLTDLDVNYEVKITKLGDKVTKVEAKRGDTYSDGTFYQFAYYQSDREYYVDIYPNNSRNSRDRRSSKLAPNYIYINGKSVDNRDLVRSGDEYKYIAKDAPVKLKFDRDNRVTEITTVFGDVKNGKVSGYIYERPSRSDSRIVLSQDKYSSRYRNDTVNLSLGRYTVDVKIDGYSSPGSRRSYYDISDLQRDYWVVVTMKDGYVVSIEAYSSGDRRDSNIPTIYGSIFEVKTSESIIDVDFDDETQKYFNERYHKFKYDRNTKFYDRGSSIDLIEFENRYNGQKGKGQYVEIIAERDSRDEYYIKRIDIKRYR
ncbi:S-layer homology domain-containing protein [uncultured Ezakiella sp.]|uniref:S-layer homology domain-containing protein n=1 Tax=uncultured Ezakiella sp. TaxID=1637529 RepID=UPI0025D5BEE6|nr:S-layer homology domain-containing protein [uncultured Ezakiella sp.]